MRRRLPTGWAAADVAVVALVTIATVVAVVPSIPAGVRAVFVVPLLLAVPGYVAVRVAFPRPPLLEDAALLMAGLSIAIVALVGLLLDRLGSGLTTTTWLIALDAGAAAGLLVARRRRKADVGPGGRASRPRPPVARVLPFVVAAALGTGAVIVDMRGADAQQERERFVQLWLVPSGPRTATVGVRSGEPGMTTYRVALVDEDGVVRTWNGIRRGMST